MAGWIITPPPRYSCPNPWNLWNVTFYDKRDFIDVIKLKFWVGTINLDYSGRPKCNNKHPYKGGRRLSVRDMIMETKVRIIQRIKNGHVPRNTSYL